VFCTIIFSIHYYVWTRIVRNAAWPAPWGKVLTISIFALAALVPLVFLTMRSAPRVFSVPLSWIVYTWMGFLFYLFMFSILGDLLRVAGSVTGVIPKDPERRRFVMRGVATGIGAAAGMVGLGGMLKAAS